MKPFLTCLIIFSLLSTLQAEEKKVVIPENLQTEYWKLRAKSSRLSDQFKQLQIAQVDISKQFSDLQPVALAKTNEIKALCEKEKQTFVETVDEISCNPKIEEKKEKEDKDKK